MSQETTIIEYLKEANDAAHIKTFRLADVSEYQKFLDSFEYSDYPMNVVVPFQINGRMIGGRLKQVVPLQGWIVRRIDQDTDVRKAEAEQAYIAPMRTKATAFITALLGTDIVDPEVNDVSFVIKPEYAFLNQRVFGVSYTMNWPIAENAPC